MKCQQYKKKLNSIYKALHAEHGYLDWWPGDTDFEVCVGAILTQNTSWNNVEKAISNLKKEGLLSPTAMLSAREHRLSKLIRSSGYFKQKAGYLIELCRFLKRFSLNELRKLEPGEARRMLLGVKGIGKETADSILLYALGFPVFVVDTYTRRIYSRIGLVPADASYDELQALFHDNLDADTDLFNDYHAQIVMLGKEHCSKKPKCAGCPLDKRSLCRKFI